MKYINKTIFFLILFSSLVFSSSGFTVTSVSLSDILYPGESETSVEWIVQISLNGGGQSLVGTLDDSEITYQGYTSAYPLQITGSTDPEQAFYKINNDQTEIIKAYSSSVQKGTLTSTCYIVDCFYTATPAPDCPSGYFYQVPLQILEGHTWGIEEDVEISRLCLYEQTIGIKSSIPSTPNIQFSSHLNLMANGEQESLDLSYDQQSATSSGGLVQANWVGSLVTGNAAPDGDDYVAIATNSENDWIVQNVGDYEEYEEESYTFEQITLNDISSSCQDELDNFPDDSLTGEYDHQSYVDDLSDCLQDEAENGYSMSNQLANNLLSNGVPIGGKSADLTYSNGDYAFVIDIPSYFVTNPVVVLRIRGDFLGVVIPLGEPDIISVTSECFNSGDGGTITIEVKNVGNAEGSFYADLSECEIINSYSQPKYSVDIGQTETIEIPIFTTGTNANIEQECTVKITDYNGGGTDSTQVTICIKEANQCDPDELIVTGNLICPCQDFDGTYKPATGDDCTYCDYGVGVTSSGGYECLPEPEEPEDDEEVGCNYDNPPCGSNYDCIDNECILKPNTCIVDSDCPEYSACDTSSGICFECSDIHCCQNGEMWSETKNECVTTLEFVGYPQDTSCTGGWPNKQGGLITINEENYACDLFEVKDSGLLSIAQEAANCYDDGCLSSSCHSFCIPAYIQSGSLTRKDAMSFKKFAGLYIIYGLGPSAKFMKDYFDPEINCMREGICSPKTGFNEYVQQLECKGSVGMPKGWASDTDMSENSCIFSDLPAHVNVNILNTGTCVDYSISLTTLLRMVGYSKDEVYSVTAPGHEYNLVKFPGDQKWTIVDTVGNHPNPLGDNWAWRSGAITHCDYYDDRCANDGGQGSCPEKSEVFECQ